MNAASKSDRLRALGAAATLVLGLVFFGGFVNQFYPIRAWLFWRYATYWLLALGWALSCLSLGYELVARWCPWLGKFEQLAIGFATGVIAYALAVFALGLVHALYAVTSIALPLAFLAVGQKRLRRDVPRLVRRSRLTKPPDNYLWALPIWGLCLLALSVLYFSLLSPEAFTFDARWYHMPMAQRYALSGKIGRFDEGFWMAAFPQLLTYLYTWVFLLPGLILFDRMELGVHLEFLLFVVTLAQIPLAVRRIAPDAPRAFSWCVRLAFPGVYLYDSNLNAGADHVAGFFMLPLLIAILRAWPRYEWRRVALVAVLLSALGLTKYTAYTMALSAGILVAGRGLFLGVVRRRRAGWLGLGALCAIVLVLTAPHWLKNWLWYGDPLYPQLAAYLPDKPWGPESAARRAALDTLRRAGSLTPKGVLDAVLASFTFSFIPNDWEQLHRDVPIFGSLFTLTLPVLFFLKRTARLWAVYLATMLALVFWYLLSHYDRYLQTLMPVMAAATAATLGKAWRLGRPARAGVMGLVSLQLIWGGDVPFIRTHNQIGDSPIRHVALFLASGFERWTGRLDLFPPLPQIGRATPKDAVLLVHDLLMVLGTNRNWVTDLNQSAISYGDLRTPRAIHQLLKKLGVTHLAWANASAGFDSFAGDLAFFNYASKYTEDQKQVTNYTVARLADTPPPAARGDYVVAIYGCGMPFDSGLYPFEALRRATPETSKPNVSPIRSSGQVVREADFVVVERACNAQLEVPKEFKSVAMRGQSELFIRQTPRK